MVRRFAALYDLHWGYEVRGGHKKALHDPKAWGAVLAFLQDFQPHDLVFGGDILDCGVISHHTKKKPRKTEGFRLLRDATECKEAVILPALSTLAKDATTTYITGNHEDWLEDLLDEEPGLEGIVNLDTLLGLETFDKVLPQGGMHHLGKLWFAHGDQIKGGGENKAKAAELHFDRNIRIGHYHTYQTYTRTSAVDNKLPKTGTVVPCLCAKDMAYNESAPNKWAQGFLWGYVFEDGTFCDYVSVITKGRFHALGKTYKG